jgi:hypothetical protein
MLTFSQQQRIIFVKNAQSTQNFSHLRKLRAAPARKQA